MGASPEQVIAALDAGSSRIALLVAARDASGGLRYRGGALVDSAGIQNGVVVNITQATAAIERAVAVAEDRLGRRLPPACIAVNGRHLGGHNQRGHVDITPAGREITTEDVAQAITDAREHLQLDDHREFLHEIPRTYVVDGQAGIQDPEGLAGYELDVEVHYATAAATALRNLLKCVRQAGIVPELAVAAPLAMGEAVRDTYADARSLVVVDMGAESANLAIYVNGTIWMTDVLLTGGAAITREIVSQLKLPFGVADELKLRHGQCDPRAVGEFDLVEMPVSSGIDAFLPHTELARAIQDGGYAFADELAERLEVARKAGVDPEALVLTGGGAELPGLDDLLRLALEMPVFRAQPRGVAGLPPEFARPSCAGIVGLAVWYAHYASAPRGFTGRRHRRALSGGWKRLLGVVMP